MLPEKADASWLWDMLSAAEEVREAVRGMAFEEYLRDRRTRLIVERLLEIIGEAARRVSRPLQESHSEIPWQKIVAHRHVMAHEYGDIKHDLVWRVATVHVSELIEQLRPITPPPPSSTAES